MSSCKVCGGTHCPKCRHCCQYEPQHEIEENEPARDVMVYAVNGAWKEYFERINQSYEDSAEGKLPWGNA